MQRIGFKRRHAFRRKTSLWWWMAMFSELITYHFYFVFVLKILFLHRKSSQLRISKVQLEDAGVYSCQGRSAVGETSPSDASVNVVVLERKPHSFLCDDQSSSYCFNGGTCWVMAVVDKRLCEYVKWKMANWQPNFIYCITFAPILELNTYHSN